MHRVRRSIDENIPISPIAEYQEFEDKIERLRADLIRNNTPAAVMPKQLYVKWVALSSSTHISVIVSARNSR